MVLALAAMACNQDAHVGDEEENQSGDQCLSDGEVGDPCELGAECCSSGTFCYYDTPCNVETDDGCYTEGWCREQLDIGEECNDPSQCADPEATCAGPLDGPATCTVYSEDLDDQRCDESQDCSSADGINRVCVDSYCKRMQGERCTAPSQCWSNTCSGTGPDYYCS